MSWIEKFPTSRGEESFKHISMGYAARATAIQIPKTFFVVNSIRKKIIGCFVFAYLEIEKRLCQVSHSRLGTPGT
jgi:hypothetical protein